MLKYWKGNEHNFPNSSSHLKEQHSTFCCGDVEGRKPVQSKKHKFVKYIDNQHKAAENCGKSFIIFNSESDNFLEDS